MPKKPLDFDHQCWLVEQAIDAALKNDVNPDYIRDLINQAVQERDEENGQTTEEW